MKSFGKAFWLGMILWILAFGCLRAGSGNEYLQAAEKTARWIDSLKFVARNCQTWAADEGLSAIGDTTLYSGASGVILFYLELFYSTHDRKYLNSAEQGARFICRDLPSYDLYERRGYLSQDVLGLYGGVVAGVAYTLNEVYKATQNTFYREQSQNYSNFLSKTIRKHEKEKEWFANPDIVSGSAGIGLFLLYAYREFNQPEYLQLAELLGERLLEAAVPVQDGWQWPLSESNKQSNYYMPNFSHGTAGVSYFLARLYEVNHGEKYLKAALEGARHLEAIATPECLIYHDEPDGKNCFYLGWCHGPAGTGRLYYLLWKLNQDGKWLNKLKESARAIMTSGIPERQTSGFWNNVSMCCGTAGLVAYFLNLYDVGGDPEYLAFAKRLAADLLKKATQESGGLKWIQAEFRKFPDYVVAQTGYMQGAAGIGICFLHLADFEKKQPAKIILPDSPFAYRP